MTLQHLSIMNKEHMIHKNNFWKAFIGDLWCIYVTDCKKPTGGSINSNSTYLGHRQEDTREELTRHKPEKHEQRSIKRCVTFAVSEPRYQ